MELLTTPGVITFSSSENTDNRTSTIDLTFASKRVSSQVEHCRVLEVPGFESDHRIIETTLLIDVEREVKTRLCWIKANELDFSRTLMSLLPPEDPALHTREQISDYIVKVCDAVKVVTKLCVPTQFSRRPRRKPFTELELPLAQSKAELDEVQGRYRETKDGQLLQQLLDVEERVKRMEHEMWRRYTDKISKTMGGAYRLAGRATKFGQPKAPCQMGVIVHENKRIYEKHEQAFVIQDTMFKDNASFKPVPTLPISQELSDDELRLLLKGLPKGEAAGPDAIPNEALRMGGDTLRRRLLCIFRACLKMGYHPPEFKDSTLVLIRKEGKPLELPKS